MRLTRRSLLAAASAAPFVPSIQARAELATPAAELGYAHPGWLIEPDGLQDRLRTSSLKIVALTPAHDFATAHIPGAVQIDWSDLGIVETSDQQVATWRASIEQTLTRLGLSVDDAVVVYDGGTLYAPRLWWVLYQLGQHSISILNGGLPAWTGATFAVEKGSPTPVPAASPFAGVPNDDAIATLDEVKAALGQPGVVLIDARTPDEYTAGHIPGAVNVPFTDNALPHDPKRWKPAADLVALYSAAGVTNGTLVIPYCSTGVRSAATYFTLRLIGHDRASLFTGSFEEWTRHLDLPVTKGDQP